MLRLFIDGTVAGSNIHQIDQEANNDHTYYGNGVWPSEYPAGETGSEYAGQSNLAESYDGENQRIGVYYRFTAATSGSGTRSVTTENFNIPDSFCPLGWQMPYGGTGGDYYNQSRSWIYLFGKYGYNNDNRTSLGVKSYPISYIPSGYYNWGLTGKAFSLGQHAVFFTITNAYQTAAWRYDIERLQVSGYTGLYGSKSDGFTVRCIVLHRRHGGRKRYKFWRKHYQ